MSTGDNTQYLRGKLEVRKHHGAKPARFMEDGFDRWAETNTPARQGQMEKIPAPPSAPEGEMTLSQAKKLSGEVAIPVMDSQYTEEGPYAMQGSGRRRKLRGGFGVTDIINSATALVDFAKGARKELPRIIDVLRNLPDAVPLEWDEFFNNLANVLDAVDQGLASVGAAKHGGAINWTDIANKVFGFFQWLHANRESITSALSDPGLNNALTIGGQEIPKRILWVLSHIPLLGYARPSGMGRHGKGKRSSSASSKMSDQCSCSHGGRKVGGRKHGGRKHGGLIPGFNMLHEMQKLTQPQMAQPQKELVHQKQPIGAQMRISGGRNWASSRGGAAPPSIHHLFNNPSVGMISTMRKVQAATPKRGAAAPPSIHHLFNNPSVGMISTMRKVQAAAPKRGGAAAYDSSTHQSASSPYQGPRPVSTPGVGKISMGRVAGLGRKVGGASPWIAHVKAFAAQHGISYKEALSQASASYHK